MKISTKAMLFSTAMALGAAFASGAMAQDALTRTNIVSQLQSQIGSGIVAAEVKFGPTQVKVEVIDANGNKVETVYTDQNGVLVPIKTETEAADAEDMSKSSVEVKSVTKDFEDRDDGDDSDDDIDGEDDDSEDDDSEDDDSEDDGGDDDSNDDSDDDSGDDSSDDHGGDDDGGDDDGGDDD
ncbi:PepSY domain-containing protein [Paragemmobacter aquarius]|uniref:PepSY domain-containing protein n=1 Tax=Paragemmobacter aquarius TaxID=2169400 RepID=UPI00131EDD57|nr:PepSY domain-containing protein [Gemmobacter aquarius]